MPILIRIALRNLFVHRSKSLIIGSIIALGVIIIIVGNGLMDTASTGIHNTFIANYTGDVFVSGIPKAPGANVSVFGVQSSSGELEGTPVMPAFDAVLAHLSRDGRTAAITSQVTGFSTISTEGNDKQSIAVLFGVDPATYRELFSNTVLVDGRWLHDGEEGIVIPKGRLAEINNDLRTDLKAGDKILLNGFSAGGMGGGGGFGAGGGGGFKIREVPIIGVVDFTTEAQGIDLMCYVSADTVRILSGMNVTAEDVVLTGDETALLAARSESDIFGGDETIVSATSAVKAREAPRPQTAGGTLKKLSETGGSWQFLLVRLKSSTQAAAYIRDANAWFASQGIGARAGDWKAAAGPFAQSIDVIRIIFTIAILIAAIVAVIIIMNTLVISVIERTGEIGTMRALGARKPFVWQMFLTETLTVTVVFGIVGILLASGIIGIINAAGIEATNSFVQILFAGKTLHMALKPSSLLMTIGMVALVGLISHLYPVSIAMKVAPVTAMQIE
jgi:putative ABC transport system permease protein